ncbi:hypothetical protein ACWG0P_10935 [Amedibacillus sp. YH-ame6]
MNKRKSIVMFLLVILFSLIAIVPMKAKANSLYVPVTGTSLYEEEEGCDGCQTSDFISDALKSLDEETAKEESGKNYVRNYFNSAETAITDGIDIFDPSTIPMVILNMITKLLELIGTMVTYVVMLVYNIASSSFIPDVVDKIFVNIDKIVFDWSNPNSWIMKILLIVTLMGILYQLIKNFKRLTNWKAIMELMISSLLSMFLIVFIGQNGRNIVMGFEKPLTTLMTQTFDFTGEENTEIANKTNLFDILQMQPFILRNFGSTTVEGVANRFGIDVTEASDRVQTLLDDPSEENAEKEYEDYKNTSITHDPSSAGKALFVSAITLIHRIAISFVLIVMSLSVGVIKLAKVILLGLSVYQLIWWMLKRSNKAWQWFTDRLLWCFLTVIADVLLSVGLYFITSLCAEVATKNIFYMLAVDIGLIVLLVFAINNISTIMATLKEDGGAVVSAMMSAGQSPGETFGGIVKKHDKKRKAEKEKKEKENQASESEPGSVNENTNNPSDDVYDENLAEDNVDTTDASNNSLSDQYDFPNENVDTRGLNYKATEDTEEDGVPDGLEHEDSDQHAENDNNSLTDEDYDDANNLEGASSEFEDNSVGSLNKELSLEKLSEEDADVDDVSLYYPDDEKNDIVDDSEYEEDLIDQSDYEVDNDGLDMNKEAEVNQPYSGQENLLDEIHNNKESILVEKEITQKEESRVITNEGNNTIDDEVDENKEQSEIEWEPFDEEDN